MKKSTSPASKSTVKVVQKTLKKVTEDAGFANGTQPHMRSKPGKMVYFFGQSKTEGDPSMKMLLGGKGANLADMTSIGLPVPPG
ncbi:MAG: hypothetical protein AABZ53_07895, partial [Planctomycetota bacterium]